MAEEQVLDCGHEINHCLHHHLQHHFINITIFSDFSLLAGVLLVWAEMDFMESMLVLYWPDFMNLIHHAALTVNLISADYTIMVTLIGMGFRLSIAITTAKVILESYLVDLVLNHQIIDFINWLPFPEISDIDSFAESHELADQIVCFVDIKSLFATADRPSLFLARSMVVVVYSFVFILRNYSFFINYQILNFRTNVKMHYGFDLKQSYDQLQVN